MENIIGRKIGRLCIVRKTDQKTYKGRPLYLCRCDCGNETLIQSASFTTTKSCGCIQQADVGHRILKTSGYYLIKVRKDLKKMDNYKYEHVYVMEQNLGREIKKDETVHHINGIKTDNRIENLELWASNHPRGQRVSDLVEWAKTFLREYEPNALSDIQDQSQI